MGDNHTGADRTLLGLCDVLVPQRLNRKEKYHGGTCRYHAAIA
jgi:hypothetical protein